MLRGDSYYVMVTFDGGIGIDASAGTLKHLRPRQPCGCVGKGNSYNRADEHGALLKLDLMTPHTRANMNVTMHSFDVPRA